jgi:ubiquinone/menaquinone biosynthesis C-methylase UbiE
MAEVMEFDNHAGKKVLEIGGGIGTDLAQFACHGAHVTDIDLSQGHLKLAEENFRLRGLRGKFIHHDAETLPFSDKAFDLVYSNGVIHHTPNTARLVSEIFRVLRPGGRAIVMVYAENSWHYWFHLVFRLGMLQGQLEDNSIGEIMSRNVELTETGTRPLVKVYTKTRLETLFRSFSDVQIYQRQLTPAELPRIVRSLVSMETAGKAMGWNLIVKARKP